MSLINCPECNKEVSNRAKICPNCGFPITIESKYEIVITGYHDTDTSACAGIKKTFNLNLSYDDTMNIFNNCPFAITECDTLEEATLCLHQLQKWGIDAEIINPDGEHEYINYDTVFCPKCGSTNIQIVPRKWSLFTGLLTNKTDRVCMKCKYKF